MSTYEREVSERQRYANSILADLIPPAFEHLRQHPDFLNDHTVPGHFPWGFTGRRDGLWVETTTDTPRYIADFTNYWMTLPIEPSRHFGSDHELLEEIGKLVLLAGTTSEFGSVHEDRFVAKMLEVWPKAQRIALYNSGTQATDMALKWANALVMNREGLNPRDMQFAAAVIAFHGRCGLGGEGTRTSPKTADFQTGKAWRMPDPVLVFDEFGQVKAGETNERLEKSLERLRLYFQRPEVSSLILEYPIIAEGGVEIVNPEFLPEASTLCHEYGKLLILDCVQMFGKNGAWLSPDALQYADAITIGKYSRVCAAMFRDVGDKGFTVDYIGTPGKVGGTWMGQVGQVLATNAIMRTVEEKNLFANGIHQARDFYTALQYMVEEGMGVSRPRMAGSYVGVDVPKKRDMVVEKLQERGVLILPAGTESIRFAPRLDAEDWENELLLQNLTQVLREV